MDRPDLEYWVREDLHLDYTDEASVRKLAAYAIEVEKERDFHFRSWQKQFDRAGALAKQLAECERERDEARELKEQWHRCWVDALDIATNLQAENTALWRGIRYAGGSIDTPLTAAEVERVKRLEKAIRKLDKDPFVGCLQYGTLAAIKDALAALEEKQ